MKSVYFQLVGGASGDMLLSSLIGLGCPLAYLKKEFKKLKLDFGIGLRKDRQHKFKQKLYFEGKVDLSYKQIYRTIQESALDNNIKEKAAKVYKNIFAVERKIHKTKGSDFNFHHLGELDAILEICGFFLCLEYLQIDNVYSSVFPLDCAQPATLGLLKGKRVQTVCCGYETITPTAAALLKEAIQNDIPFSFERYGLGYGSASENDYLIAYLFPADYAGLEKDTVIKIETNIDDMNPQVFEDLFEKLYASGAREVYIEQVVMKKSRPGFVLNVLCMPKDFTKIKNMIFAHTTTFGIRYQLYQRNKLKHKFIYKKTRFGKVKFRVSESSFKKEIPEYEDCLRLAKKLKTPLLDIYRHIQ